MTDVWCSCRQWAEHYGVPTGTVYAIVADQFLFERSGIKPLDAEYYAQMANDMLTEELVGFYEQTKARLAKLSARIETAQATGEPLDLD